MIPTAGRHRFLLPAAAAVVLAVVAAVALVIAVTGQQSPPQPAAAAAAVPATDVPAAPPSPVVAAPSPPETAPTTPAAEAPRPVALEIPAIDARSDLIELGLNDDGTVQVPPLEDVLQAGWYTGSPRPGAVGPALLLGHVDSAADGPGIFFDLGALTPGDSVDVTRADGSVAAFTVDRVEVHPKADFPTIEVYGNTTGPELRLITCGGAFDSASRDYADNIVVYASLTGIR
ncbi:class F sortase [Modestobacter sp. VKM Ac-2977]|uniref:class F sortase n=1 Tax=Modestobacter sp. VKM Ac-2977 TaxID=3004131 RepID=UPI0022AA4449|nr:class F sortase [Modestobacter sp. VKM Ac-2977]MCZ2820248.1 class F sortase [Modestobacter sp. VKM Ac-2977]